MSEPDHNDVFAKITELVDLTARFGAAAASIQARNASVSSEEEFSLVDLASVSQAWARTMSELLMHPEDVLDFTQKAATGVAAAWWDAWISSSSGIGDKRFRDRDWEGDPVSRGLRDAHLAVENAVEELLSTLPSRSKDYLRAQFYARQFMSALSPANFLGSNPAARRRYFETHGQSAIDGMKNFLDDIERGGGRLDIATNDSSAFHVGRDLATTPGKVIYQNDLMQLIQYEPMTEMQHRRPMLLVPAWINKYYILDMRPKNSLVRYLLERGHSVFVISWVNPRAEHADRTFADYMKLGPLAALDAIRDATGEETTNVLGFCIGGILVMATLAWLAARGEARRIGSATTLATMVDFTNVGEIGVFIDNDRLKALRAHMQKTGYLENYHLQDMFSMIRENDLVWSFHVMNYLMGRQPPAFDLLFWNSDSTRLPAAMLLWYIEKIYIQNGLRVPGGLELDGTPLDLARIKTPLFVLATKEDHIAPWKSVYPTTRLVSGKTKFVLGGSGHIAGVINPPGERQKYGYWIRDDYPEDPESWRAGASYVEGSWWPEWAEWLEAHNRAKKVAARVPGEGKLSVIEDAPGSYVLAD